MPECTQQHARPAGATGQLASLVAGRTYKTTFLPLWILCVRACLWHMPGSRWQGEPIRPP